MIYTSYFAKLPKLPKKITPISICAKAPYWYSGLEYKRLAPKYGFFMEWKQNHDNDYYIKCFNEQVLGNLNPNDVIADFFCGSGTTLVVAKELGRQYIGCDINPRAVEISDKRLNDI